MGDDLCRRQGQEVASSSGSQPWIAPSSVGPFSSEQRRWMAVPKRKVCQQANAFPHSSRQGLSIWLFGLIVSFDADSDSTSEMNPHEYFEGECRKYSGICLSLA